MMSNVFIITWGTTFAELSKIEEKQKNWWCFLPSQPKIKNPFPTLSFNVELNPEFFFKIFNTVEIGYNDPLEISGQYS